MHTSLKCAAAFAALFLTALAPASKSFADDAVTYRTNGNHTAQTNMPDFVSPVAKLWTRTFTQPTSYPLITSNYVFVVTYGAYNSNANTLYCLNKLTGTTIWGPITLPNGNVAGFAYDNNRVFVAGEGASSGNEPAELEAYSASKGQKLWDKAIPGQFDDIGAPTPYNGEIYLQAVGQVSRVRESDGSLIWSTQQYNTQDGALAVSPAGIFISGATGDTYSLDPLTGDELWYFNTGYDGGGGYTCAYYDNDVFIHDYYGSTYGEGAVLDAINGSLIQSYPDTGPEAFDNGLKISVTGNTLSAVRVSDLSTVWSVTNNTSKPVTAPTIVNNVVYIGTSLNDLFGYDENTGKKLVSIPLGATPSATSDSQTDIGAGDGILVVPSGDSLIAVGNKAALSN